MIQDPRGRSRSAASEHRPAGLQATDPVVMGPSIVWLSSAAADGVPEERIVAIEFEVWLRQRFSRPD
jgi:hypothetical protein